MIAALCSWHEHHEAAANEIESRLAERAKMIVAAPALVEAYAVLTRFGFGDGDLLIPENVGPADLVDADCFH
jgi:hypothetical protein